MAVWIAVWTVIFTWLLVKFYILATAIKRRGIVEWRINS